MAELDNANQELEAFKRWWDKAGTGVIIILIIVLLGVLGWYAWGWYTNRQNAQAAEIYAKVQQGLENDAPSKSITNLIDQLESSYQRTPYASAAALELARHHLDRDELDDAADQLHWAVEHSRDQGMRQIAVTRLARVLWSQDKDDQALKMLDRDHPPAFDPLYAELTGDIHAARDHRDKAYAAYKKALDTLPEDVPAHMLETKMNNNAPAATDHDKKTDTKSSDS